MEDKILVWGCLGAALGSGASDIAKKDLLGAEGVPELLIELVFDVGFEVDPVEDPVEAVIEAVTPALRDVVDVLKTCVSVLCHRTWTLYAFTPNPGTMGNGVVLVIPPPSNRTLVEPDEVKTLVHVSVVCQLVPSVSQPHK